MSLIDGPVKKWKGHRPIYDDGLTAEDTEEQLDWNVRKRNLEDLLGIKIISRSQMRRIEIQLDEEGQDAKSSKKETKEKADEAQTKT